MAKVNEAFSADFSDEAWKQRLVSIVHNWVKVMQQELEKEQDAGEDTYSCVHTQVRSERQWKGQGDRRR